MKYILKALKKYGEIILAVLLTFIGIKLINNYKIFVDLFSSLKTIVSPFIIGAVIAYCINPLMKVFEIRLKFSRGLSLLLSFIIIILLTILNIKFLLPGIISNLKTLIEATPSFMSKTMEFIENYITNDTIKYWIQSNNIIDKINANMYTILSTIFTSLLSITSSLAGSLIKWTLGFVISAYYLYDKEHFILYFKKLMYMVLKEDRGNKFIELLNTFDKMIGSYIGIRAVESAIVGLAAFIGLILLDSNFVLLISLFFGVTNMIPYFGPFLGIVFGTLLNVFYGLQKAFFILILLFILQQIDGNWLGPKLSGKTVGIHPVFCIFALAVGGAIYGAIGMLIAVPIAGVIKIYWQKFIDKYEENHPKLKDLVKK